MDVGGVSPAELSAAIGTPVGQLQAEYNQLRPKGLFSTGVPAPRGLPEDFALQTGAYGAPTPTFLALPEKKTATSAAETPLPSGSTQNTDTGSEYIATDREGGLIKMAEGGGPPKMAELSAARRRVLRLTLLNILTMRGAWLAACRSLFVMRTARLLGMKAATYHCRFSVT
jgi:hypothetical protein